MFELFGSRLWSILGVLIAWGIAQIGFTVFQSIVNKKFKDTKGPSAHISLILFMALYGFMAVILGPLLEELIFRSALLVFFKELTFWSWVLIVVLGLIFGLMHKPGNMTTLMFQAMRPETSSIFNTKIAKNSRMAITTLLGIACGYLVVRYQSLYIGVLVHAGWNFLGLLGQSLPMVMRKMQQGWLVRDCMAKCKDCGWEYNVGMYDENPRSVLHSASMMHDMHWLIHAKAGDKELPHSPCRHFHFTWKDGEFDLFRTEEEAANQPSRPPASRISLPQIIKQTMTADLPLIDLLRQAADRMAKSTGAEVEVSQTGEFCNAVIQKNEGGLTKESILTYRIKPESDGWTITVHGVRLTSGAGTSYDVKMSFYISQSDLNDPEIVIEKLISTF